MIIKKQKAILQIDPNVTYAIQLSFDGTAIHVFVDNVEVMTVPAGSVPFGTVCYQAKNTTARFGFVCVN